MAWQGTIVPNSGYVEKVYFNTSLSNEEVMSIIANANLTYEQDLHAILMGGNDKTIIIYKDNCIFDYLAYFTGDNSKFFWVSPNAGEQIIKDAGFTGWNPNFDGFYEINSEVLSTAGSNLVGSENNKLTKLVSITPEQETTADKLQKLIDGKTFVVDKVNYKANSALTVSSKWEDIGNTIEEKLSSGNTLINNLGFTEVPNENYSYIDNIYFNTSLNADEVVSILEGINLQSAYGKECDVIVANFKKTKAIEIIYQNNFWRIENIIDNYVLFSSETNSDLGITFTGWNPNFDGVIEIKDGILDYIYDDGYKLFCGNQNYLLKSLVSNYQLGTEELTTLDGEYDGTEINFNTRKGWQGTTIPTSSNFVSTIYFNTSLSVEETNEILKSITLDENMYYILSCTYSNRTIGLKKINDVYILYQGDYNGTSEIDIYYSENNDLGDAGWQCEQIAINSEIFPSIDLTTGISIKVGQQNEVLSSVISLTPFKYNENNIIDMKSYIENKKIPLKIKVEDAYLIEAEEIPTTNIKENTLYKVNEVSDINVFIVQNNLNYVPSLYEYIESNFEITPNIIYYLVDSFPSNPNISDISNFTVCHVYILKDIAYMYDGSNWRSLSYIQNFLPNLLDGGYVNSPIDIEYPNRIYVTYKLGSYYIKTNKYKFNEYDGGWIDYYSIFHKTIKKLSSTTLKQISQSAFYNCRLLETVDLPNVIHIGLYAFTSCISLKSVNLPKCRHIDQSAFSGCSLLTDVYLGYDGKATLGNQWVFSDCPNTKVHVRAEYLEQYQNDTYWAYSVSQGYITLVGDYTD